MIKDLVTFLRYVVLAILVRGFLTVLLVDAQEDLAA